MKGKEEMDTITKLDKVNTTIPSGYYLKDVGNFFGKNHWEVWDSQGHVHFVGDIDELFRWCEKEFGKILDIPTTNIQHKCRCDFKVVLNRGCRCGGV